MQACQIKKIDGPEEGKSRMIKRRQLKHLLSILCIFLYLPVICIFITEYHFNSKYIDLDLRLTIK